jgi:hypothetical protein
MAIEYLERDDSNTTQPASSVAPNIQYLEREDGYNPSMEDSVMDKPQNEFNWFSSDDWNKAAEGLDISLFGTPDNPTAENQTLDEVVKAGVSNIGEGTVNALRGAAAGVNDFAGDMLNTLIPSSLGGDAVEDWFDKGADFWREGVPENSVGAALGEELGYGAGVGEVAKPVLKYGGKALGYMAGGSAGALDKFITNRGIKYGKEINKKQAKRGYDVRRRHAPDEAYEQLHKQGVPGYELPPHVQEMVADEMGRNAANHLSSSMVAGNSAFPVQQTLVNSAGNMLYGVSPKTGRAFQGVSSLIPIFGKAPALSRAKNLAIDNANKLGYEVYSTPLERTLASISEAEARRMLENSIKTLPRDTAKKYSNALERVLSNKWSNRAINTGVGGNALDSALQQALDNAEEERRRGGR